MRQVYAILPLEVSIAETHFHQFLAMKDVSHMRQESVGHPRLSHASVFFKILPDGFKDSFLFAGEFHVQHFTGNRACRQTV